MTLHVGQFLIYFLVVESLCAIVSMALMWRKWILHGFKPVMAWQVMWVDLGKFEFILYMFLANVVVGVYWLFAILKALGLQFGW